MYNTYRVCPPDNQQWVSALVSTANVIHLTREAKKALDRYDEHRRRIVTEKLLLLSRDPRHPSLRVHPHTGCGKLEAYISLSDRVIFDMDDGRLNVWDIGPHSIVDRADKDDYHSGQFIQVSVASSGSRQVDSLAGQAFDSGPQPAVHGSAHSSQRPSQRLFEGLSNTSLRILGVPAELTRTVRRCSSIEELEKIDGLPEETVNTLLDFATAPNADRIIYDQRRLVYSTTFESLEGFGQGRIREFWLNLTPEQSQYVDLDRTGLFLLKGAAGSGKTTIGIYRAIRRAERGRRVVLLAFSKYLAKAASVFIEDLIGDLPENLEVRTVVAWMRSVVEGRLGARLDVAGSAEVESCIEAARDAILRTERIDHQAADRLSVRFIADEIKYVIKGLGIESDSEYQITRRYGRGTALQSSTRTLIWRVYVEYQRLLCEMKKIDWEDIPLLTYKELVRNPLDEPYDDVIVDECQDLSPMQLRVVQRLAIGRDLSKEVSVFMMADASQAIFSRGLSWKQAGIDLRGRAGILRKNFRNTQPISEVAVEAAKRNIYLRKADEYIDPELADRPGPKPVIIVCKEDSQEPKIVADRIVELVQPGSQYRFADIAVLCPRVKLAERMTQELQRMELPADFHYNQDFDILEETIKVLTLHAAKGLEFPVVFIVGLRSGVIPWGNKRMTTNEHEEVSLEEMDFEPDQQRNLFYVGVTRACDLLYLVTTRGMESEFLEGLDSRTEVEPLS